VTTPADGTAYQVATMPATFIGNVADNTGGVGLNANTSTTFTLERNSDTNYWNGTTWQTAVFSLTVTNIATTGDTTATWGKGTGLPNWSLQGPGTYIVQATVTDKAGNTFTGPAATF